MKEEELTCIKVLEAINTYLITPFFTESLLDIIKNTFSSNFSLFSFNKKLKIYFLSTLHYIKTTKYFYL